MNYENKMMGYIIDGECLFQKSDCELENLFNSMVKPGIKKDLFLNVFWFTTIADEEVRDYQEFYPDKAELIENSFVMLTPSPLISNKGCELYRAHCIELLERQVNGEDLEPATDAEIIGAISDLSLKAPLERGCVDVMQKLFVKLFPHVLPELTELQEDYPDSCKQIEMKFRKELSRPRAE